MTLLKLPIYLDNQATTPLDPRVLDAMMPYFTEIFGNPHSTNHSFGWQAEAAVEIAREQVANLIGASKEEIIFTSGATESNNIALKGMAYAAYPQKKHIITVKTEHTCVLESCKTLEKSGFQVTYLNVGKDGLLDLNDLKNAITSQTSLVSVMSINNEIGVIQNIKEIGAVCTEANIAFHTDAAQAVGKIPLNVNDMMIDLMSISSHKFYGPKGVGALFVRNSLAIKPLPLFDGGGQEKGLRSGTLAPALCFGLGMACKIAGHDMDKDLKHISKLYNKFKNTILNDLSDVHINGSETERYPGNLNFTFNHVKGDLLVKELRDIAISTGSACSTEKAAPSQVLMALGMSKKQIDCSVRIGMGRMTTDEEVDYAINHIIQAVTKIRSQL